MHKNHAKILALITVLLLVAIQALAEEPSMYKRITSSTVVCSSRCLITSVFYHADGSNQATFNLYDESTAATGTLFQGPWVVVAGDRNAGWTLPGGVRMKNGLYITVSGTGAWVEVTYKGGN